MYRFQYANKYVLICGFFIFMHVPYMSMAQQVDFTQADVAKVQKRYYLIQRLEKAFSLLAGQIAHEPSCIDCLVQAENRIQFKHPAIKQELHEMATIHSISPLYKIWNDILSYKYLDDELFIQEALSAMVLMLKNLPSHAKNKDRHDGLEASFIQAHNAEVTFQEELSTLLVDGKGVNCLCAHHMAEDTVDMHVTEMAMVLDKAMQVHDMNYSNVMRHYVIKRLTHPLYLLNKLCSSDATALATYTQELPIAVFNRCCEAIPFTHSEIRLCLDSMRDERSFKPCFSLWKKIATYDLIEDTEFIRQYVQLLIITYDMVLLSAQTKDDPILRKDNLIQDILHLYQHIASLPLVDMFETLELFLDRFDKLVNDYHISDQNYSWGMWLKKYWWALPVSVTAVVFSFAKVFFNGRRSAVPPCEAGSGNN